MQSPIETPHSGLGIASFIISLCSGVLIFFVFVIAGIIEINTPGGIDEESLAAALLGLAFIGLILLTLLGVVLGIIGLIQENRRKLFAILGTIFGLLIFLGSSFLLLLGIILDA